jgi:hypothetical protein
MHCWPEHIESNVRLSIPHLVNNGFDFIVSPQKARNPSENEGVKIYLYPYARM